jgi:hypothetical protein
MKRFVLLLACLPFVAAPATPQPALPGTSANWAFDELTLTNGAKFQGLILSEGPEGVRFQCVFRLPGRPTVTLTDLFSKAEVARVDRLSFVDRVILARRLAELDPGGEGERRRMESLELVTAEWPGKPDGGKLYDSDYFTLLSTGSEELTRRSAVRLEQIYTAFTRFLPPTFKDARPTRIMLATDRDEYKILLGPLGEANLLNPAVFDPRGNRILCGSDLRRLGADLQSARLHHAQQLASLVRYEETVRRLYKGAELERYLDGVRVERKRVTAADTANGVKFDQATARLFAILYHEAFHAYAGTFVYPPLKPDDVRAGKGTGELPRWLNEGMAQLFETAVLEAGELRADTPNRDRLHRAQDWVKGKKGAGLLPLADLLATGKEAFLTSHADQKTAADRAYLTSWALAYYLTFERRLIGTAEFNEYLVAVNSGGDPRAAFAALVGQDLPAFEKAWHAYLLRLRSDGTLGKP